MVYIKDPVEILDDQIERQVERAEELGGLECVRCAKLTPIDDCHPFGSGPAPPPICGTCLDEELDP
jgi:hypothetical protein